MIDLFIIFVIISLLGIGLMLLEKKEDEFELIETNKIEGKNQVVKLYEKRKITE